MDPIRFDAAADFNSDLVKIRSGSRKTRGSSQRPSVGVLVDLALTPTAGGHVRFWNNIAHAAARIDCGIDLSFHFQSDPNRTSSWVRTKTASESEHRTQLSDHVRIIELPPVFSTARLGSLVHTPDHTDLSPHHRRIVKYLRTYDVVHTTDAYFAYAKTASRVVDPATQSLVTSIHTDTPAYTRVYSERAFRSFFGDGWVADRIAQDWKWPDRAESRMRSTLARHLRACEHIWYSPVDNPEHIGAFANAGDFDVLERGLDWQVFSPDRRDREQLEREFALAEDDFVLSFAGRIDIGKEVMVAARAVRALLDRGKKVKLILAGIGADAERIRTLLGPAVRLPGFIDQRRLASLLASSDAFVFPSRIETAANAVIEARASGLPVLTSPRVGNMLIREDGVDGVVVHSQDPSCWANAVEELMSDRDRSRKMGALASAVAVETHPSWSEVLEQELVPGWLRSLRGSRSAI